MEIIINAVMMSVHKLLLVVLVFLCLPNRFTLALLTINALYMHVSVVGNLLSQY